jgi:CRP/FNR family transcriptional regulator
MKLGRGQALFREGDPATRVFTLTCGSLKLYTSLADGRRQVAGFMHPGDFLGISVEDQHAFTAEALEDAQLCWFPRSRFDDFVQGHASMEHQLYRIAAHELAVAQQQLVLLGRKTATERMASFLLTLLERAEQQAGEQAKAVDLPMGRLDIADYLGLTKETVSRVISALRNQRVIRLQTLSRIEIVDRKRLRELSEGGC